MAAQAIAAEQMVVFSINTKQTFPPGRKGSGPWWLGLTLDQQDDFLDRIDPQRLGPGEKPPMPVGRWNREKRRIRKARERWIEEIWLLRRPCGCSNCVKQRRPPFPSYYVVNGISYECWLEEQTVDQELEEELDALRNDRCRTGAAVIANGSWNIFRPNI